MGLLAEMFVYEEKGPDYHSKLGAPDGPVMGAEDRQSVTGVLATKHY